MWVGGWRRGSKIAPVFVVLAKAGTHLYSLFHGRIAAPPPYRVMIKQPAVYILASRPHGTLYIGVSSNLLQRVWQHKSGVVDGFTDRYDVHRLVYFEIHTEMLAAITREKHLKKWKRDWKVALIEKDNPDWRDLWPDIVG